MNSHNIEIRVKNASRGIILPNKGIVDKLNAKLKAIEHSTKANWDNYAKLGELKRALRSRNNYLKEQTIKKYEVKP